MDDGNDDDYVGDDDDDGMRLVRASLLGRSAARIAVISGKNLAQLTTTAKGGQGHDAETHFHKHTTHILCTSPFAKAGQCANAARKYRSGGEEFMYDAKVRLEL